MRFLNFPVLLLLVFSLNFPMRAHAIHPAAAGALSIVPGLGEVVEGHPWKGLGYFSALLGLWITSGRLGGAKTNAGTIVGEAAMSLYFYQIYAAYRDGNPKNKMYGKSNVFLDYAAAFNPINVLDFKVIGFDAVAGVSGAFKGQGASYNPLWLLYWGVGVQQEEALYRGFLYPVFTDIFGGYRLPAALVTSVLDSAQHILYEGGAALTPYVFIGRTVIYCYLTWMYTFNDYDLPRNIFAHAWFDYLLRSNGKTKTKESRLYGVNSLPIPEDFEGPVLGFKFQF
jgi:membrane protease YdiL (CAAX protease family)